MRCFYNCLCDLHFIIYQLLTFSQLCYLWKKNISLSLKSLLSITCCFKPIRKENYHHNSYWEVFHTKKFSRSFTQKLTGLLAGENHHLLSVQHTADARHRVAVATAAHCWCWLRVLSLPCGLSFCPQQPCLGECIILPCMTKTGLRGAWQLSKGHMSARGWDSYLFNLQIYVLHQFFLKNILYLFVWEEERQGGKKREGENFPPTDLLPKCPQQSSLAQTKIRSQELNSSLAQIKVGNQKLHSGFS